MSPGNTAWFAALRAEERVILGPREVGEGENGEAGTADRKFKFKFRLRSGMEGSRT